MSNKLLHQIILNFAVKKTETIFRQQTNLKLKTLDVSWLQNCLKQIVKENKAKK